MIEPFAGVKVADFSWAVVGPLMTKFLADFGGQVVKIESHIHPDSVRLSAPFTERGPGVNRSGYFALINANKYSISLDLTNPRGKEVALDLVRWADVVVESFRPGVMSGLGFSYADLKKVKPDIIMLSTSTQGQEGPYRNHPGFGFQVTGLVGFPWLVGWPDRIPVPIPIAYTDYTAYYYGAAALIAALGYRQRTGKGLYLDLSQVEAGIQFLSPLILDYTANSRFNPERVGNSSPGSAPHGVYRCKGDDRWCTIAVSGDGQWQNLVEAMGRPIWAAEPRFSTLLGRKQNEDELNRLIEAFTINFSPEELMNRLQAAGVPCGVVADGSTLIRDPHIKARGYYWEFKHPEMGTSLSAGQPFHMSRTSARPKMASPCLGEHTEYVCKEFLKMSDDKFVEVLTAGSFE